MTDLKSKINVRTLGMLILVFILALSGCSTSAAPPDEPDISASISSETEGVDSSKPVVLARIKVTTDSTELHGVLYDNSTSRDFIKMLPITVSLWTPADFAKAFDLDQQLSDSEPRTRSYQVGGLAYWHEGPAVAIFHNGYRDETVVPVITLGQLDEGGELFSDYSGDITIELLEE